MASAVFFANGFGDSIICRPTHIALASVLPRPSVFIYGGRDNEFMFRDLGYDAFIKIDWHTNPTDLAEFNVAQIDLTDWDVDLFVSSVPWFSRGMQGLIEKCNARRTVGYFDAFTDVVSRHRNLNAVEQSFDLARLFQSDADINDYKRDIPFSAAAKRFCIDIRRQLSERGVHRVIAVHAETAAAKMPEPRVFSQTLCQTLSETGDVGVFVVGGRSAEVVCPCHAHRMFHIRGLNLELAMAAVASADIFFGVDSCMLHVADYCGVPGAALFGDSDSVQFGYYWTEGIHINFKGRPASAVVSDSVEVLVGLLTPQISVISQRGSRRRPNGTEGQLELSSAA